MKTQSWVGRTIINGEKTATAEEEEKTGSCIVTFLQLTTFVGIRNRCTFFLKIDEMKHIYVSLKRWYTPHQ